MEIVEYPYADAFWAALDPEVAAVEMRRPVSEARERFGFFIDQLPQTGVWYVDRLPQSGLWYGWKHGVARADTPRFVTGKTRRAVADAIKSMDEDMRNTFIPLAHTLTKIEVLEVALAAAEIQRNEARMLIAVLRSGLLGILEKTTDAQTAAHARRLLDDTAAEVEEYRE